MGVFLRASHAPANPSWLGGADAPVRCIGLDTFLLEWLAREPDNPYLGVFAPLLIDDERELAEQAPVLWLNLICSNISPTQQCVGREALAVYLPAAL